jgi:hypothetical protein
MIFLAKIYQKVFNTFIHYYMQCNKLMRKLNVLFWSFVWFT